MFEYLAQGFILGLAYVAPIGMQNLYVINSALKLDKLKAYQVALITIAFDISLALACFFGIGLLIDAFPALKGVMLAAGCIVVVYFGVKTILSKPSLKKDVNVEASLFKLAAICFAVTWLNPQAIIDGSMLLGGFRASLPVDAGNIFIAGVAIASFTWFVGLSTITIGFKNILNEKALKVINILSGAIIVLYGLILGYGFIEMIA